MHSCPAQQSVENEQAAPTGVHCTPPQKPAAQSRAQQSVVTRQALPSGRQRWSGLHTPPDPQARPEQQSEAEAQGWPEGWQAALPPEPP